MKNTAEKEIDESDELQAEMAQQALLRANVYDFLSQVYLQELSTEFLQALTGEEAARGFEELGIDLSNGLTADGLEEAKEQLAGAYFKTFVDPLGTALFPFASVQLEGAYLRDASLQVENFYETCSLGLPEEATEMPDHLGIEFNFMCQLARQEADHWEGGRSGPASQIRDKQLDFLRNHLLNWVPKFSRKLEKMGKHAFYRNIGKLTGKFMTMELEEMEEIEEISA